MRTRRVLNDTAPTILFVEDHRELRDALASLFATEGIRVTDAANGHEALEYLRASPPVSAIILDLAMPVMNGWDFLAQYRDEFRGRTVPILIFTGLTGAARRDAELVGLTVFSKPLNFDDLLAAVRKALRSDQ